MVPAIALTGTPGTGKSSVARQLSRRFRVVEVGALARRHGAARGHGRAVEVDLPRLRRALRRTGDLERYDLVVGHLAHLLPVAEAIVLRCRPDRLVRRLRRARRGSAEDRADNYVSEATDVVLLEAIGRGVTVFEIDTSSRSVVEVARAVRRRVRSPGVGRFGIVDWLRDRRVTDHLLRPDP